MKIRVLFLAALVVGCSETKKQKDSAIPGQINGTSIEVDLAAGKQSYMICATCHGDNAEGMDSLTAPKLSHLQDWYLKRQILNFQNGIRGDEPLDSMATQMKMMAKTLPDSNAINNVVAYIRSLETEEKVFDSSGDIENGKKYYKMVCGTCHGVGGEGNMLLNAPNIKDGSYWYFKEQFLKFKSGQRGQHEEDILGAQMKAMTETIEDEKILEDIYNYIQSLKTVNE